MTSTPLPAKLELLPSFTLDESTAKYKGEKMVAVYLKQEFGGFAVHLLQK